MHEKHLLLLQCDHCFRTRWQAWDLPLLPVILSLAIVGWIYTNCTRIYTNWKYIFVFVICFVSGLRRWTDPATNHTLASLPEQTLMPGLSGDSSDALHLPPDPVLACVRLSYLLHFRTGGVCCGLESFEGWRPFPIAPLAFLWNGSLSSLALLLI